MPEFYMIFARKINKMPKFYMIFAQKYFSRFFGPSPFPVSYAYAAMAVTLLVCRMDKISGLWFVLNVDLALCAFKVSRNCNWDVANFCPLVVNLLYNKLQNCCELVRWWCSLVASVAGVRV